MAFEGSVKFIKNCGENSPPPFWGQIEISECNIEALQTTSLASNASDSIASKQTDTSSFQFTKNIDGTSFLLAQACDAGTVFDTVMIEAYQTDTEENRKSIELELTNVTINSIAIRTNDHLPTEKIYLHYRKIEWTYTFLNAQDSLVSNNSEAA